ncbi:adhesin [Escherichia coli]|nr:adhesin [Escherichia coli]
MPFLQARIQPVPQQLNMNVARSYWEGNAYTFNSGDKAGSNLDINLSDSSVWKGKVSGQEMPVYLCKTGLSGMLRILNC